jgi:hypothetical protein
LRKCQVRSQELRQPNAGLLQPLRDDVLELALI